MKAYIQQTKKPIFIILLVFACTLLMTCDKIDRDNPWDADADIDPKDYEPKNFRVIKKSNNQVLLKWDYDTIAPKGFRIEKKQDDSSWYTDLVYMQPSARSYEDNNVNLNASIYSYRIRACFGKNESTSTVANIGSSTVTDSNGNTYKTVIIGEQEWMTENIRATTDAQGNSITRVCYEGNSTNCLLYGGLYTWSTANFGSSQSTPLFDRGICPDGWSLPGNKDWEQLFDFIIDNYEVSRNEIGNFFKSCRQFGSPMGGDCNTSIHPRWDQDNTNYGIDFLELSLLPGGFRCHYTNTYYDIGRAGLWWTATENENLDTWAYYTMTYSYSSGYNIFRWNKNHLMSVRCFRKFE